MRRLLMGLVILSLLLAGCSKAPKEAAQPDTSSDDPAPDDPMPSAAEPGSEDSNNAANHVPLAILSALNVTGVAPLTVSYVLNGTDADGDRLTWTFDADGDGVAEANGTLLPHNATFTFGVGNYTSNFTVDDGSANYTASVNVTVTPALPAEPPAPRGPTQVVDGSIQVGVEGCPQFTHTTSKMDVLNAAGSTLHEKTRLQFDVDAATIGAPWSTAFDLDAGYLYAAVAFFDTAGDYAGGDDTGTTPNTGDLSLGGTVPGTAAKAIIWACAGPTQIDVHYEA